MQTFKPRLRTCLAGVLVIVLASFALLTWPGDAAKLVAFFGLPFAVPGFLWMLSWDLDMFDLAKRKNSLDSWTAFRFSDGVALTVSIVLIGMMTLIMPGGGQAEPPFWRDLGVNPAYLVVLPFGLLLLTVGWPMRETSHVGKSIFLSGGALLLATCVGLSIELANYVPQQQVHNVEPKTPVDPYVCTRSGSGASIKMVCMNSKGEISPHASIRVVTQ